MCLRILLYLYYKQIFNFIIMKTEYSWMVNNGTCKRIFR